MNWNDKEEVKEYYRQYRKANINKITAYQHIYKKRNRKLLNERGKEYRTKIALKESNARLIR
jgi:hypothetical protein